MDEATRKEVERAWAVDERCRPTLAYEPDIHAALHTAILNRGWWIEPVFVLGILNCYGVVTYIEPREVGSPTPKTLLFDSDPIRAMARAIAQNPP
jgi:hypothetical protein